MGLSRRREALIRRLHTRKGRIASGVLLVEGVRGGTEALDAAAVRFVVCSPGLRTVPGGEELIGRLASEGTDVTWVDDGALEGLAPTESPQGVLLVCRQPAAGLADVAALTPDQGLRLLVLDGIQDPGNVGTLVRSAAAFGVSAVLALDGTADPWNAKSVRASAGGVFRTVVVTISWKEADPWLRRAGIDLVVSEVGGRPVAELRPGASWALVLGSEARGVRPGILARADGRVGVPMPGGSDSLNVAMAGTVLLYALTRVDAPASTP